MDADEQWAVWDLREEGQGLQVVPVNDWIEHELNTVCLCRPKLEFEYGGMVVIHDAADGRE